MHRHSAVYICDDVLFEASKPEQYSWHRLPNGSTIAAEQKLPYLERAMQVEMTDS
jgi:hypothetical protein